VRINFYFYKLFFKRIPVGLAGCFQYDASTVCLNKSLHSFMKILLIGNGGREHALAWTLSQSRHQPELFFAPGNPGMRELGLRLDLAVDNLDGLLQFALREQIDLTVVGPELPLSLGLADRFREAGLAVFGPGKAGAQLESSKAFAKDFMKAVGVPTAGYAFCPDQSSAMQALESFQPPYVIKEDGLAAGKGVTVAANRDEALAAIDRAGKKAMPVVIEEFLPGRELSVFVFCDGNTLLPCLAAQDFKRIGEGDTGPNTGGMGAYAPVPMATHELMAQVGRQILEPVQKGLKASGLDYRGLLYVGLMVSPEGVCKVVEFNVRFGDPETQVVLPLLEDDLVDLMLATVEGRLTDYAETGLRFKVGQSAVTVVLASEGYPGEVTLNRPIAFPQYLPQNAHIFHAGTRVLPDQSKVTAGGRVLTITGEGPSIEAAREAAYAVAHQVHFEGKTMRCDIAANPAH
jgi:phosphoribosylamine---glycine ligase